MPTYILKHFPCYRRLFNWFAFILFLYNGFAGFVAAIVRVFLSAAVSLLLLFRLDSVVMPKGFEFLDFGEYILTLCAYWDVMTLVNTL